MLAYLILFSLAAIRGLAKPNFVIILTDDQDVTLNGMSPMENVRKLIVNEGVTFNNSYVTSPICCPSRASLLTGLYVHNHRTSNNSVAGGCYGNEWKNHEQHTFATVLEKGGYQTFYAGKYLNQYGEKSTGGPERIPPGWSEWHGLVGNSVYYNYTLSNNGVPTHSTDLYLTDIIRDLGISFIENQTESQPFLMVLSPPAPHQPFTPAQRHRGTFRNITAVRHPNFNIEAVDKHWLLRMPPSPLPDSIIPDLDQVFRSRWEALLSVDEMVSDVVEALTKNSLLDDTYLIFTSDNGYHIGQFSQVYDKRQPYESDIRVPLIIKGPGIPKNAQNPQPVLNIDLAPTIIKLAGLTPLSSMDGRAIDISEGLAERNMLIEYYGEGRDGTVDERCPWKYDSAHLAECHPKYDCKCQDAKNNTYACLRHIAEWTNVKFCMFADDEYFTEFYDLSRDPYELKNAYTEMLPALRNWYKTTLLKMLKCKGSQNCDNPLQDEKLLYRISLDDIL